MKFLSHYVHKLVIVSVPNHYVSNFHFLMLVLYSAALLDSFIIGETFTIVSLGFSRYMIILSANRNCFLFPSLIPLIVLAITSRTRLNSNGDIRHVFFVLNLSGSASSIFHPLSRMLALRMEYIFY